MLFDVKFFSPNIKNTRTEANKTLLIDFTILSNQFVPNIFKSRQKTKEVLFFTTRNGTTVHCPHDTNLKKKNVS